MAGAAQAGVAAGSAEYEEVLRCLSSLITQKVRADTGNRGNQWELMAKYPQLQILELGEPIARLKVVHVAGTKGKGSTCTFAESILRSCGFRTGLFTSPHLMDVRERFRLDGLDGRKVCKNKTGDDIPMPAYFRFLALLAFKIFSDEQVKAPVVCGISALGYDHMEILGNTLGEIAGEKAGILKKGVPAYTVPQPEEAMSVLKHMASELAVSLRVVQPLDPQQLEDRPLGLHGKHQYMNAGLAVALANTWLERQGHLDRIYDKHFGTLPDQFIKGLSSACLQGRAQIVPDPQVNSEYKDSNCSVVFYLDGAHSPESMEMCARWFSHVTKKDGIQLGYLEQPHSDSNSRRILLFNCMSVRDPQRLLPRLLDACAQNGLHFDQALFVPNQSQYNKLGSHSSPPSDREQIDLSWQLSLQRVWESLLHSNKGLNGANSSGTSSVFESLPLAIKWLREAAQQNQSTSFQVYFLRSNKLEDHIEFEHGYDVHCPSVISFVEILREFGREEQRVFVQFTTGAPQLPHGGLASLDPKLTIVRKQCDGIVDNELPSVNTCRHSIKLPPYSSKEIMRQAQICPHRGFRFLPLVRTLGRRVRDR